MAELKLPRAYERKVTDFIVRGFDARPNDWERWESSVSFRTDRRSGIKVYVGDNGFVKLSEPVETGWLRWWNARRISVAFRRAFRASDLAAAIALLDAAMARVQG